MNNFQKNNLGNLGNLGNIANNLVNSFNSAAQSARDYKPDPVKMAQAAAVGKVALWNGVRAVVALIFAFILFCGILTWSGGRHHWSVAAWMIISILVIIRNIRKSIKASKAVSYGFRRAPAGAYRPCDDTDTPVRPLYTHDVGGPSTARSGAQSARPQKRLRNKKHRRILMPDGTWLEIME